MQRLYFGTLDDPGLLGSSSLSEPSNVMVFTTLAQASDYLYEYVHYGRACYNSIAGDHYDLRVVNWQDPVVRLYGPFTSRLVPEPSEEMVFNFHIGSNPDPYPDYELYVTRGLKIGRRKL